MHTESKDCVRIKQETSHVQLKGSCEVKSNLLDIIGLFSFQLRGYTYLLLEPPTSQYAVVAVVADLQTTYPFM